MGDRCGSGSVSSVIWELFGVVTEGALQAGVEVARDTANARGQRIRSALRVIEGNLPGFYKQDWRSGPIEVSAGELRIDELRLRPTSMSAERARTSGLFEQVPFTGDVYLLKVRGATLEWLLPSDVGSQVKGWLSGLQGDH